LAVVDEFDEGGIEFRRDDVDVGAGFEQGGNFLGGDGATTDDENAAVGESEECGEEAHGRISMR
jgi:hypothetical protein